MDVVSGEMREEGPWELLYSDDHLLLADSEEALREKILKWKAGKEAKCLKVCVGKTKIIVGGEGPALGGGIW